jgi:acetate kinase
MPDAIAVINTGSSSVKFSLFLVRNSDLTLEVRGQVEASPRRHERMVAW